MRRHALLLILVCVSGLVAVTSGCSTEADSSFTDCIGGKCDGTGESPPALEQVSLREVVACWGVLDDTTTDPFFQLHEVRCDWNVPLGLELDRIYISVDRASAGPASALIDLSPEAETEGDASSRRIARLRNDDFPITISVTLPIRFAGSSATTDYWGYERTIQSSAELEGLTTDTPLTIGPPIDLWPVVLWPTPALAAAWDRGELRGMYQRMHYEVPAGSAALSVAGPPPAETFTFRRGEFMRAQEASARDLAADQWALPVPIPDDTGAFVFPPQTLTLQVFGDAVEQAVTVDGPGYYLVDLDGSAVRTAVQDLPLFVEPTPDAGAGDAGMDGAPGDGGSPDASDASDASDAAADAADTSPPQPACATPCASSEACVGGACVNRADQTQRTTNSSGTFCSAATATCDPQEDIDCADGHACVEGSCRRLSCQQQSTTNSSGTFCSDAQQPCAENGDCDLGHACVARLCRRLSCQQQSTTNTSGTFCSDARQPCETTPDCAPAHACVSGLCRRLRCQQQSTTNTSGTFCSDARQPCEDNLHCAEGHSCVSGLCRRLSCQQQSTTNSSGTFCSDARQPCDADDDADCTDGHACVASLCRRLSCQQQSTTNSSGTFCSDARQPCETTSDCAEAHACLDGLCKRLSCLRD